jgi:hypothetical protein
MDKFYGPFGTVHTNLKAPGEQPQKPNADFDAIFGGVNETPIPEGERIVHSHTKPMNDDPRDPWVLVSPATGQWMRESYLDQRRRELKAEANERKRREADERSIELM